MWYEIVYRVLSILSYAVLIFFAIPLLMQLIEIFASLFHKKITYPVSEKKARIAYITIDEKSGVEKRTVQSALVQANDFHRALARLDEGMKGTLGEWVIVSITETAIVDVFKFKSLTTDIVEEEGEKVKANGKRKNKRD